MESAVKVTGVTKEYGEFKLKDANFEIRKGFVTGLIGSNGAGKSTLMKCITGAVNKTSGSIEFDDGYSLSQIGLVFDECPFPQYLKCSQLSNVFKRMFDTWDEKQYFKLLSEYGIDPKKKVMELSRGMSMKLQVAVAFCHSTNLLILDEPTAGMDPASRDEFLDILRDYIQDDQKAILISSHITSDLEKIADFVLFMKDGEIVAKGEKDEIEQEYGILRHGNGDCPVDSEFIVSIRHSNSNTEYLVRSKRGLREAFPELVIDDASLEEIMVMIARGVRE